MTRTSRLFPYPTARMPPALPCVIYCRVSSRKQLTEGDGLNGQEKRCHDYAVLKGYAVRGVFREEAVSGGSENRPAMQTMLTFLDQQHGEVVVIVDDLKRFARDVELHFDLKLALMQRGGRLESPGFRFEDSPEGKFIETIVAAQAELERNQNKRQVVGRMKARLERGFWTFMVPPGYKYEHDPVNKSVLIVDEARAGVVKEALEGFGTGRFASPSEVMKFLASQGFWGADKRPRPSVYLGQIKTMLHCVLYAGYLEYKPWDVSLRKAFHPALISLDMHFRIQRRLLDRAPTLSRADRNADFALRNLAACQTCGRLLTASWSRGRSRRYPYYHCQERRCGEYGRTIARDRLEGQFERLLQTLATSDDTLNILKMRALEIWGHKEERQADVRAQSRQALRMLEVELRDLADKLASTRSEIVTQTLEARIEDRTRERALILEQEPSPVTQATDVGTAFETARNVLKNPYQIWKEGDLDMKRVVTRLAFTTPLPYDRKTGFGTTSLSLPYLLCARFRTPNYALVDPTPETWNMFGDTLIEWVPILRDAGFGQVNGGLSE